MFAVTLGIGLVVVAAVALSPLYLEHVRLPPWSTALGAALVATALLLALPAAIWRLALLPSDDVFLAAFVLLLLGALLIIAGGRDDDPGVDGDEPPWWPSFELDFRSYARRQRRFAPTSTRR